MKHSVETQRDWQRDLKVKREVKITNYKYASGYDEDFECEVLPFKHSGCSHTPSINFSCN